MNIHFTDLNGVGWMILPGLPEGHPANQHADTPLPFTGMTFRASTGELRVLLWRDVARRRTADWTIAPLGTAPRVRGVGKPDWQALLAKATPWSAA